jgi:NAD(P)H-flavin reductase
MYVPPRYIPKGATITAVRTLTEKEKVFTIKLDGGKGLAYGPGQFVMLSVFGVGEAPISISSSPLDEGDTFDLCIRAAGALTGAIHRLEEGGRVGIRGPFGKGFPTDRFRGKDVIVAAGGLGLAPLRSLIDFLIKDRRSYGRVIILVGARRPEDILYKDLLSRWDEDPSIEVHTTVDAAEAGWEGNVGVITTLFRLITVDPTRTVAAVCGAPVMYRFVLDELLRLGLFEANIFLSLERRMRCGLGRCGHCQVNGVYLCQHGPVLSYLEAKKLKEAL